MIHRCKMLSLMIFLSLADKMRGALESDIDAPKAAIDQAHRNLDRVLFDIKQAKQAYLEEKEKCDLTERYWKKVCQLQYQNLCISFASLELN